MGKKMLSLEDYTDDVRILIISDMSSHNYINVLKSSQLKDLLTARCILKNHRSKGNRLNRIQAEIKKRIFEFDKPPETKKQTMTLLWQEWFVKEWNKMTELYHTGA